MTKGVIPHMSWTCPLCAHPSPGRHTHMEYDRLVSGGRAAPTGRECPGRAIGRVASVTIEWPPTDELVERMAEYQDRRVNGSQRSASVYWRRVMRGALAAALGDQHETPALAEVEPS